MKRIFLLVLAWAAFAKTYGQSPALYSLGQADTVLTELNAALHEYHPFALRGEGSSRLDSATAVARASLSRPARQRDPGCDRAAHLRESVRR